MKFEVCVELKGDVLDVQGRAIKETLARLGHQAISDVRVSKRFVLELDDSTPKARSVVDAVAKEYLASSVAETYVVKEL